MKTFCKMTLLGLVWATGAAAQDLQINSDDCEVALDSSEPVTFRQDGGISVTTAAPLPVTCVSGVIGGGSPASVQAAEPISGALVNEAEEDTEFVINYAVPEGFNCVLRRNGAIFLSNANVQRPGGTSPVETITTDTTYLMDCELDTPQGTAVSDASAFVDYVGGGNNNPDPVPGTACTNLPPGTLASSVTFTRQAGGEETARTVEELLYPDPGPTCDPEILDCDPGWPIADDRERQTYRLSLRRNQYYSLPFVIPPGTPPQDILRLIWEESVDPSDGTIVSVSTCVGGVLESEAVPQQGSASCYNRGGRSGGRLLIGTSATFAGCVLQPGQTYYLNFMDYDPDLNTPTCNQAVCDFLTNPRGS